VTREELIAALERTDGPSRKLDAAIYKVAVGLKQYESIVSDALEEVCVRYYPGPPGPSFSRVPRYTSSLDAALTLVPEGWDWCIACISGKWDAQVGEADTFMAEGAASNGSVAIALCIAALKARA